MLNKTLIDLVAQNNYNFIHMHSSSSTMDEMKNYLKINKKNSIVLSDIQTAGRGRIGNKWLSPAGNIYCSISFSNFLNIKDHFLFSILIAMSLKTSLEKLKATNINFKWPNDIFYKDKKFAGIISEIYNLDSENEYIIMGLGINVKSAPNINKYNTTFINSFLGITEITSILEVFLSELFYNLQKLKKNNFINLKKIFSDSLMFKNKFIKINFSDKSSINGIFKDINTDGSLQLESEGIIKDIYNGSIEL